MASLCVDTPFGRLRVTETSGAISRLAWTQDEDGAANPDAPGDPVPPVLGAAAAQLAAYATGRLRVFDLPLRLDASDFQRAVCDLMRAIPFGQTRSYGEIAAELGVPAQAVGRACGANPVAIVIPCHRVMGAGGRLVGFSGGRGVETKLALLKHENAGGFLL